MYKHTNKTVIVEDLGIVEYNQAWEYQTNVFQSLVDQKIANRALPEEDQQAPDGYFLFCEHPHVYTLGKSGKREHLLINESQLKQANASYYEINRGGDITYHGPGQIVGYPILDLDNYFTDIHKYLRLLEETIILTLNEYGLSAGRIDGLTGVWIDFQEPDKARKICAMGVKASRWVTMHGFALNIQSDLTYFKNIVPCGIEDKQVTSLEQEIHKPVNLEDVKAKILHHASALFGMTLVHQ